MTVAAFVVGGLASALLVQGGVAASSKRRGASARANVAAPRSFTKGLVADLRKRGFEVNPGYPILYATDACPKYTYPALHDCFGNNPASPYVIPVVKAWPNEYLGPTPANVFGKVRPGYTPLPRMDPRDAIVIYGTMPPPGKYMSVQTWVWSQPGHWMTKDYKKVASTPNRPIPMQYLFTTIPPNRPNANRVFSFSTLGDVVNNVVMQRQSGYSFGKKRYLILTASATTDHAVRHALQARGVPGRDIFTTQIPSRDKYGPIGPLGMGKNSLDFNTFFRYAIPDNPTAAKKWWANPPLTVLRVRAPSSLGPVRRYGLLTYGKRTAHSEAYLAHDLQNLEDAVCNRASSTAHLQSTNCTHPLRMVETVDELGWSGPYCRSIKMFCGDQQEAAWFIVKPLPLDSGRVYAVLDTLATETHNATYVGLGVNDASTYLSPAGVLDTTLKGSADGYANTVKNTGKFFVHYFTRDCNSLGKLLDRSQDCTPITDQMVPPKKDTSAQGHPALKGMFIPALRDYIEPGTTLGAKTSKLLTPRILAFTQP